MAIQTFNTKQTDSGWNPQSYNPFPGYKPYNPFATGPVYKAKDVTRPVQQQAPRNAFGANWTYDAAGNPVYQPAQRRPTQPAYNQNLLPLPVVTRQSIAAGQQQELQRQQQQGRINLSQLYSGAGQQSLFNIPGINDYGFPRGISQGSFVPYGPVNYQRAKNTRYNEWLQAGGVNKPVTDWFDPYDPAGSPYMTSQYITAPEYNYDYGSGGGGGGWGGWGGGGGYDRQDSAAFYQGNYTQRRNRWNETLLTWGLRQQ